MKLSFHFIMHQKTGNFMSWLIFILFILISNFSLYANYSASYQNQKYENDSTRTRPLHRPFPDRKDSSVTKIPHRPHIEEQKPVDNTFYDNRPIRPVYYSEPARCELPYDSAGVSDIDMEVDDDMYFYDWDPDWKTPRIGISFERHFFFREVLDNMDYVKISYTGYEVNDVSLQVSLELGSSNRFTNSNLTNLIDGRIRGVNLDIGLVKHFSLPSSPMDYYFTWGGSLEILKWKYHEALENYYSVVDNKDGTVGYGLYLGIGVASLYFDDVKFGLEAVPGVIFIPEKTDNELDNIMSDLCYMRFNFYVNFDTY